MSIPILFLFVGACVQFYEAPPNTVGLAKQTVIMWLGDYAAWTSVIGGAFAT